MDSGDLNSSPHTYTAVQPPHQPPDYIFKCNSIHIELDANLICLLSKSFSYLSNAQCALNVTVGARMSSVHRGPSSFPAVQLLKQKLAISSLLCRAVVSDEWNSLKVDLNVALAAPPRLSLAAAAPTLGVNGIRVVLSFLSPAFSPQPRCWMSWCLLPGCSQHCLSWWHVWAKCNPLFLSVTGFPVQCRLAPPVGFCFQLSKNTRRPSRVPWVLRKS